MSKLQGKLSNVVALSDNVFQAYKKVRMEKVRMKKVQMIKA
jgi:hypothetical protein